METVLIKAIADELSIVKEYALRLAKKNGFQIHYGKRRVASLSKEDAEKLIRDYQPQRATNATPDKAKPESGYGHFYLIQLVPDELPSRFKLGFTDSIEQRLSDHRTTNPTLRLVKKWPCKRIWERAAIDSITRNGCTEVGHEVYDGIASEFIQKADAFFQLMPNSF